MTTAAIGKLLDSYLTDVEGQSGFWRGTRDEITAYASSDLVFLAHGDEAPGDREEHGEAPGAPPRREGPESE